MLERCKLEGCILVFSIFTAFALIDYPYWKIYYLYFMFPQDVCVSVNNPNQMSMSCVPDITTTVPSKPSKILQYWLFYASNICSKENS